MNVVRVAKISLIGFAAVALQFAVAAQLPVAGAMVDVVLLATIAAAMAAGPEAGAGMGFSSGLVIDLLGGGPVGLTALINTLVGYGVGIALSSALKNSRLIPVGTAAIAALIGVYAYALMGEVVGQQVFAMVNVPRVALVVTVSTALLCLPFRSVMRWAFAAEDRPRFGQVTRW